MDSTGIGTTNRTSYLLDYDAIKSVTQTVRDEDTSFYRMDKKFGARSKNDGAWHNYHSISTFSSTSSAGMSELYGKLLFDTKKNCKCHIISYLCILEGYRVSIYSECGRSCFSKHKNMKNCVFFRKSEYQNQIDP